MSPTLLALAGILEPFCVDWAGRHPLRDSSALACAWFAQAIHPRVADACRPHGRIYSDALRCWWRNSGSVLVAGLPDRRAGIRCGDRLACEMVARSCRSLGGSDRSWIVPLHEPVLASARRESAYPDYFALHQTAIW